MSEDDRQETPVLLSLQHLPTNNKYINYRSYVCSVGRG